MLINKEILLFLLKLSLYGELKYLCSNNKDGYIWIKSLVALHGSYFQWSHNNPLLRFEYVEVDIIVIMFSVCNITF